MRTILVSVAAALLASSAGAVTVINGSFEMGIPLAGQTLVPVNDTTSITGWKVLGGAGSGPGVYYTPSSVWDAASGVRSIGLAKYDGVGQRVYGFTPGKQYKLNFSLSAYPNGANGDTRAVVSVTGGVAEIFTYTKTAANSPTNMLYQPYSYLFTAGGTAQNIMLRGLSSKSGNFAVLDDVSISLVPEPAAWALMIAGFGMVGLAARRRRITVAA